MAQPMRSIWARNAAGERSVRTPGMASSLSSVPPVWPSARPDSLATGTPQAATSGTTISETVSPTPPEECLSTTTRSPKSSTSPERTMASVSAPISSSAMPRIVQAIASAAIAASSTVGGVAV